ncbi:MAG TPA: hypothetical protein VF404_11005 [Sphingomonas sp.]
MTMIRLFAAGASLAGGAALLMAATAPAFAAGATPNNDSSKQEYTVKHDASGKTIYCATVPPVTGSRISQQVCKTAKEWKRDGVQLDVQ